MGTRYLWSTALAEADGFDSGAQWQDPANVPPGWNLDEQLAAVPPAFR